MSRDIAKLNIYKASIIVASSVVVCFGMQQAYMVILPLIIAYIVFAIASPLSLKISDKTKIPSKLISILLLLFLISVFILFSGFFISSLNQLIDELSVYFDELGSFFTNTKYRFQRALPSLEIEQTIENNVSQPLGGLVSASSLALKNFLQIILLSLLSSLFFFLEPMKIASFSKYSFLTTFNKKLVRYFTIKAGTSFVTSLIVVIYLYIFDYKFLLFIGISTFILNFIPSFGSIIATAILIPVIVTKDASLEQILIMMLFPACVQFIIGNLVEPKLMGDSLRLSSVTVILCLIFWSIIFAGYGLFLGVPLTLFAFEFYNASSLKEQLFTS